MTRKCAWCGTEYGEKCPECGQEAEQSTGHEVFCCVNEDCPMYDFKRGAGGTTTGLCLECAEKRKVTAVRE